MSDTWSNLLSGVVGAIVGGAASLAGTVLVNKLQMATNARMRMYDELLPKLERALRDYDSWWPQSEAGEEAADQVAEALTALQRASAIAGRPERRAALGLASRWADVQALKEEVGGPAIPGTEHTAENKAWYQRHQDRAHKKHVLRSELQAFSDYLGDKLG